MTDVANMAVETAKAAELSNAMVVGLGLGTVFVGLISLIVICYVMSAVCKTLKKEETAPKSAAPMQSASVSDAPIANKQEVLAACCAVIAEELGTEANNIKVLSFKRV